MAGTRARVILADIDTAMRAVTLDRRAGVADRITPVTLSRLPEKGLPERTMRKVTSLPGSREPDLTTSDSFRLEVTLEIFYALHPEAELRIHEDCERYWWVLETLHTRNADIQRSDPSPLGIEETPHNLIFRISLVVLYRVDSAVLN